MGSSAVSYPFISTANETFYTYELPWLATDERAPSNESNYLTTRRQLNELCQGFEAFMVSEAVII
jgi:hypothetical protein